MHAAAVCSLFKKNKRWEKGSRQSNFAGNLNPAGRGINPALLGFGAVAAPLGGFEHRLASPISQRGSLEIGSTQQEKLATLYSKGIFPYIWKHKVKIVSITEQEELATMLSQTHLNMSPRNGLRRSSGKGHFLGLLRVIIWSCNCTW